MRSERDLEHVLFECGRYERFRRKLKGVILHERKIGIEIILRVGTQEDERKFRICSGYLEGKEIEGNGEGTNQR